MVTVRTMPVENTKYPLILYSAKCTQAERAVLIFLIAFPRNKATSRSHSVLEDTIWKLLHCTISYTWFFEKQLALRQLIAPLWHERSFFWRTAFRIILLLCRLSFDRSWREKL